MEIDKNWLGVWSKWIISDTQNLQKYLCIAKLFPNYSINNQILLVSQSLERPISMLKDEIGWNKDGVSIVNNNTPFYIWEPDKDSEGNIVLDESSKKPAGYHYKPMYDVLDTDCEVRENKPNTQQALESLLSDTEIRIVVCDEIKNVTGKRAMYVPIESTIYVVRSGVAPADEFFCAIATELGHAYCHQQMKDKNMAYNRASYNFGCTVCAHALAEKYNVQSDTLDISVVPDRWVQMSERGAFNELLKLRNIFENVNSKMESPLKKIMERDERGEVERAVP